MIKPSVQKFLPTDPLIVELLDALDKLFGLHPGFRAVHAKGVMGSGTFMPAAAATGLTPRTARRRPSTPVVVRLSDFAVVQLAGHGDVLDDSTAAWPNSREEIEFGSLSLTKYENHLEPEFRKIIFDPIPRVDGIDASDDPLLEVRAAMYLASGRRRRAASAT